MGNMCCSFVAIDGRQLPVWHVNPLLLVLVSPAGLQPAPGMARPAAGHNKRQALGLADRYSISDVEATSPGVLWVWGKRPRCDRTIATS